VCTQRFCYRIILSPRLKKTLTLKIGRRFSILLSHKEHHFHHVQYFQSCDWHIWTYQKQDQKANVTYGQLSSSVERFDTQLSNFFLIPNRSSCDYYPNAIDFLSSAFYDDGRKGAGKFFNTWLFHDAIVGFGVSLGSFKRCYSIYCTDKNALISLAWLS